MTLGEQIRKAREQRKWTQGELAAKVGVTPSYITKLEKDEALPSYERLLALSNVLLLDCEHLSLLVEQARQKRTKQRISVRSARLRRTLGMFAGDRTTGDDTAGAGPVSQAEQLGREILGNPDLQSAFVWLRGALVDPDLKAAVLKTLEAFAQQAKPAKLDGAGGQRKKKSDRK